MIDAQRGSLSVVVVVSIIDPSKELARNGSGVAGRIPDTVLAARRTLCASNNAFMSTNLSAFRIPNTPSLAFKFDSSGPMEYLLLGTQCRFITRRLRPSSLIHK